MPLFNKKSGPDPEDQERLAQELRVIEAVASRYPDARSISFGAPTRCPDCGDYGFVVNVNHGLGLCSNRCLACSMQWTISRRALELAVTQIRRRPDGLVVPPPTLAAGVEPAYPPAPTYVPPTNAPLAHEPAPAKSETAPGPHLDLTHAPLPPAAVVEPVAPIYPRSAIVEPVPGPPPGVSALLRVLVVEDNPFDLAIVEMLLEPVLGEQVELVNAMTLGEAYGLARDPFDVVLLDLHLPDSADGIATILEWQHHVDATVPVIVVSGESDGAIITQARGLGIAHFIQKQHLADLTDDADGGCARFMQLLNMTIKKHARGQAKPTAVPG